MSMDAIQVISRIAFTQKTREYPWHRFRAPKDSKIGVTRKVLRHDRFRSVVRNRSTAGIVARTRTYGRQLSTASVSCPRGNRYKIAALKK